MTRHVAASLAFLAACVPGARGFRSAAHVMRGGASPAGAGEDAGAAPALKFFTLDACPYAQRCWILLLELNVDYERVPVTLRGEGSDREWYVANVNPRGKVPALMDGGFVVYESLICNEYLCDKFNGERLLPAGARERAEIRLWNEHLDTQLAPAHFTLLMAKGEEARAPKRAALGAALAVYEERVGEYLCGDEFTLADVNALPFFERLDFSLKRFHDGYDALADFPRTRAWFERCKQRPSFAATRTPEENLAAVYRRFLDADYDFGGLNRN